MRKPNLIIAGAVKGGTTSLFEYLGKHPDIGVSKVKETCFFLPVRYREEMPPLNDYLSFFSNCSSERYVMESTPGYLDGGRRLAQYLHDYLDEDARIVFSLRSPSDRLLSFYRYKKSIVELPKEMTLDDYLTQCLAKPVEEREKRANDAFWGVDGGRYIEYLPEWFEVFGKDRIKVVFFDDLAAQPGAVTTAIAQWLGIDSTPFGDAAYGVENKTVPYKFAGLHRMAIGFNKMLEPTLRRYPSIKKNMRNFYYLFNSGRDESRVTDEQKRRIDELYRSDNMKLGEYLATMGYVNLPEWLSRQR